GDHRSQLDVQDAMRATNDQNCVGRQLALLCLSKGDWQVPFQSPSPVIRLKTKASRGRCTDVESRHADISAGLPTHRQVQGEKRKRPGRIESRGRYSNSPRSE